MPVTSLTAAFVRSAVCPPGKSKVDYFDDTAPGFLLEVRATGGKTFYQRYTDARGAQHQVRIGPAYALTITKAKKKGREILSRALLGEDPHAEKLRLRSIPTLTQFARDNYLPHAKGYKRSWKTDETMLRVHILPYLGRLHLDEISPSDVGQVLTRLRDQGYAAGTVGRALVILRFIFNLAKKWRIPGVPENPTAPFKVPADVERNRFLTAEEASRLIASIEADQNQIAAKAIMLLLLTGARRNEVTQAKWAEVDWERARLTVPFSKSGKPRRISLNSSALALLRSVPRSSGNPYIFPSPRTWRPSPQIFFPWDRIRKRAGLDSLRLHDLRHSFASFLVNNGTSLYVVQNLLGHAHGRTTQRYAHLASDTLSDAAEIVATVLRAPKDQSQENGNGKPACTGLEEAG